MLMYLIYCLVGLLLIPIYYKLLEVNKTENNFEIFLICILTSIIWPIFLFYMSIMTIKRIYQNIRRK